MVKAKSIIFLAVASGLLAVVTGCDPVRPEDRAYLAALEEERAAHEGRMRTVVAEWQTEDLIRHVQQHPAPEGDGDMQDWLLREAIRLGGQPLFPRWLAVRRGSNIQEMRYQFMLMDRDANMRRYAFSWELDVLDMRMGEAVLTRLDTQTGLSPRSDDE